jgi:hypothetical protein
MSIPAFSSRILPNRTPLYFSILDEFHSLDSIGFTQDAQIANVQSKSSIRLFQIGNGGKCLMIGHGLCESLPRNDRAFVHQEKIDLRIEHGHVGRGLKRTCRLFNAVLRGCEIKTNSLFSMKTSTDQNDG